VDLSRAMQGEGGGGESDEDEEGEEGGEGGDFENVMQAGLYSPPDWEVVKKLLKSFKESKEELAGRFRILLDNTIMKQLYYNDPTLRGTLRTVNLQQIRVIFTCYVDHCDVNIGKMVETYREYRLNMSNFKVANGCVCQQKENWEKVSEIAYYRGLFDQKSAEGGFRARQ
jgi:hypothetical protein